jgi:hypothetical protein
MRYRTTFLLLACFAALLGALWWADYAAIPTEAQRREMVNRVLPELLDTPVEEIRRIEVERGSGRGWLTVERRGEGRWQILTPVDTAADTELVETLARNLKDLRKSADAGTIDADPTSYGLQPPSATVRVYLKDRGMPAATLEIGNTVRNNAYVRPAGTKGVEVVDARLLAAVEKDAAGWRDANLFRVPSFRVASVAVERAGTGESFTLNRAERKWLMTESIKAPADDEKAEGLVAELSALRVADGTGGFVEDSARDLARYGLDHPSVRLTMTPFGAGAKPQVVSLGSEVPDVSDQVYALRGDQDDVVRINVRTLRASLPAANGFRSTKVLDLNPGRVSRFRVEMGEKVFELSRVRSGWVLTSPVNEPADPAAAQTFLARLAEMKTSEFLDSSATPNARLDQPSFHVRVWQAELSGSASAADSAEPQAEVVFGRHDRQRKVVYAQIAGDTSVLTVPDDILEVLPKNAFAFRDRTVLTLRPEQVLRMTVERPGRPGVTVEAPRAAGSPVKWRMTEPVEAPTEDAAVTALVVALSNLRAEDWESETVGDGRAYGLDAPGLRIKWTVRAGPVKGAAAAPASSATSGVLRLGKNKPGSLSVYANIEGDSRVFSLKAGVLAAFEAELRSHLISSFKPEQVERMVLRWPSRTVALSRAQVAPGSPRGWQTERGYDPAGVDAEKVAALVNELSALKTGRFLQYSGPLPASAGLSPAALWATLKIGSTEKTLRLGNVPVADQAFATDSAGDEGAVFVVSLKSPWKDLLQTPGRYDDLPADVFAPASPAGKDRPAGDTMN